MMVHIGILAWFRMLKVVAIGCKQAIAPKYVWKLYVFLFAPGVLGRAIMLKLSAEGSDWRVIRLLS